MPFINTRLYCLLALLIIPATPIIATVADLELSMDFDLSSGVVTGQTGQFSITITNHGPDDAGLTNPFPILATTSVINQDVDGTLEIVFSQENISQQCIFLLSVGDPLPGDLPIYFFSFHYPDLPVNTSVTCFGLYQVGIEEGEKTVEWLIGGTDIDPNPDNNTVEMVFKINPPVIPSTSSWSVLVLISLIFLFMMRFYQRKR